MVKTFVLDTNVLIHDNDAIFQFADNRVVLPLSVLEELDNLKNRHDEKGYNARMVARKLDRIFMAQKGELQQEVRIGEGTLRIEFNHTDSLPAGFEAGKKDNLILQTALYLKRKGERVIFVSKDLNARIKARALGLEVNDYEKEKVAFESLHPGWTELAVAPELVNRFYADRSLPLASLGEREWLENTYLILRGEGTDQSALCRVWPREGVVKPLAYDGGEVWGVKGLNAQQRFALDLLLDDQVTLVALVGSAGTGKTLLAMAAALRKTLDERRYRKILVARPIMPLGKDIGYLPGTKEEKLSAWMEPIFDNLYFLVTQNAEDGKREMRQAKDAVDYLLDSNLLELGALTYIRGRSIPHQFVVIDEAQNLTPHEIKTVVSRVGEGSKIVLTGDAEQIDNPYLDADSNGLSYLIEKFKGQELFGAVNLVKSERSRLASLAAKLL